MNYGHMNNNKHLSGTEYCISTSNMENYPGTIIEDKGSALSLKIRIHGETNLIMKTTASYHSINPAWKNTIIAQSLEQDPEFAKLI